MRRKSFYKLILWLLLFAYGFSGRAQQQSQYTQYMYNTVSINPAYAGMRGRLSMLALYRNQWVGIDGAPETLNFAVNTPVGKDERVGLGLEFTNDRIGPTTKNTIAADFSYVLSLNREVYLAFGIKGGFTFLSLDPNKLTIFDQSGLELDLTNHTLPIVGAGLYVYGPHWYIGLSTPNFLETKHYSDVSVSMVTERTHLYLLGGYNFSVSRNVLLKPVALIKAVFGAPVAIDVSLNTVLYDRVTLGVGYRWDAAVSALAGFKINDQITIGYAYDYTTTELAHYNSGSHEIFLRFEVFTRQNSVLRPSFP